MNRRPDRTDYSWTGPNVRIDVLTLFPGMFPGPLSHSILGRAGEAGLLAVFVHDLRPYAEGKHRVTDEPPFGGLSLIHI